MIKFALGYVAVANVCRRLMNNPNPVGPTCPVQCLHARSLVDFHRLHGHLHPAHLPRFVVPAEEGKKAMDGETFIDGKVSANVNIVGIFEESP